MRISSSGQLRWRHWQFAVGASLFTIGSCFFVSFALGPLIGHSSWLTGWDTWWTVRATQWITYGGIGTVYKAVPLYLCLPGLLFILTPFVEVGSHFGLVTSYPYMLAHPSMWLIVGPVFFVLGATTVLAVDYLADTLGAGRWCRRVVCVAVGLLVVDPTVVIAGHPEDLLALGLSCLSLALLLRGRPSGAATVLSIAVIMQPWAGLLIPILVAATPAGRRTRSLVRACTLPLACGATMLALDLHHAFRSLVEQPQYAIGNVTLLPWRVFSGHTTVMFGTQPLAGWAGSPTRSLAVLTAVGGAIWVWRNPTPRTILAASATALLARAVFETVLWAWYIAPAAVIMVLLASTLRSPYRRALALSSAVVVGAFDIPAYWTVGKPDGWLALAVMVVLGGFTIGIAANDPVGDAPEPATPMGDSLEAAFGGTPSLTRQSGAVNPVLV